MSMLVQVLDARIVAALSEVVVGVACVAVRLRNSARRALCPPQNGFVSTASWPTARSRILIAIGACGELEANPSSGSRGAGT